MFFGITDDDDEREEEEDEEEEDEEEEDDDAELVERPLKYREETTCILYLWWRGRESWGGRAYLLLELVTDF